MRKAKVLIVDDHPVARLGLCELIRQEKDLAVCGSAEGIEDGVRLFRKTRPDLVLVDLSLKDGHGLDLIKRLNAVKHPPKMVVVSMYEGAYYVDRALRAGAHGYVPKSEAPDQIIEAVRTVLAGGRFDSVPRASRPRRRDAKRRAARGAAPAAVLSDREWQVFELIGQGIETREIGERLGLSKKTIDVYRQKIKCKLSLKNAAQLSLSAILSAHERK